MAETDYAAIAAQLSPLQLAIVLLSSDDLSMPARWLASDLAFEQPALQATERDVKQARRELLDRDLLWRGRATNDGVRMVGTGYWLTNLGDDLRDWLWPDNRGTAAASIGRFLQRLHTGKAA